MILEDVEAACPCLDPGGVGNASWHKIGVPPVAHLHLATHLHPHGSAQHDSPLISVNVFGNDDIAVSSLVEHHQTPIARREIRIEVDSRVRGRQCLDEVWEFILHSVLRPS